MCSQEPGETCNPSSEVWFSSQLAAPCNPPMEGAFTPSSQRMSRRLHYCWCSTTCLWCLVSHLVPPDFTAWVKTLLKRLPKSPQIGFNGNELKHILADAAAAWTAASLSWCSSSGKGTRGNKGGGNFYHGDAGLWKHIIPVTAMEYEWLTPCFFSLMPVKHCDVFIWHLKEPKDKRRVIHSKWNNADLCIPTSCCCGFCLSSCLFRRTWTKTLTPINLSHLVISGSRWRLEPSNTPNTALSHIVFLYNSNSFCW